MVVIDSIAAFTAVAIVQAAAGMETGKATFCSTGRRIQSGKPLKGTLMLFPQARRGDVFIVLEREQSNLGEEDPVKR